MNKQEYLERLQACLKHKLSKEEIEDIMRDYAEYFEEGRRQSKQDSEIAAKLGDPELVVEQLIEESQEQQVEYKVPGKGKEKKLGEYVGEYWKKAKQKFHDWDHGEAKHTAQQEEDTAEEAEQDEPENLEQEEMEKQTVPKKEPRPRREKFGGDGVLVRSLKVLARACRWCAILFVCFWLMLLALGISGQLALTAGGVLGALLCVIVFCGLGFLLGLLGIILSGFGFAILGSWSGVAIVSASVACLALTVLLEMLLVRCLRFCWGVCKQVVRYALSAWERMLDRLGAWLGIPETKEKREKEPEEPKPERVEVEMLPPSVPATVEAQQPQNDQEEGC